MKTLNVGSFANVTTVKQSIVICLAILEEFAPKLYIEYGNKEVIKKIYLNSDLSPKEMASLEYLLNNIIKQINRYVPPFTFFGYHPIDHSNLGVWLDLLALHEAEFTGKLAQVFNNSWRGLKCTYILDMGKEGIVLYHRRSKKIIWTMV